MRNFKKFLALVLATMMVLSGMVTVSAAEELTTAAPAYDYTEAAEDLAALGVVKGTSDDVIDFALEDKVLRYQMALLVARITTGECDDDYWQGIENTTPFNDIDKWFGAIEHCYESGIIWGKEETIFDPYGPITYEQALTMAVRALGYKQLDYYEGFVNYAKKLGLTEGLEELAIGTQLTRGQMFQIIYNTLFALGTDNKTFAAKNFGVVEEVYVVVATERQHLAAAGSKTGVAGVVRLAKLNADGTYDYENTILLNAKNDLGLKKDTDVEAKLAYSYTVTSSPKAGVYKVVENATEVFQNYGDTKAEIAKAVSQLAYLGTNSVKIGKVSYKLVEAYSANAIANELIVHSLYKEDIDVVNGVDFDFDAEGNILYPANYADAALAGKIGMKYNAQLGSYFFVKTYDAEGKPATLRPATDDDLAVFATTIAVNGTKTYGIETEGAALLAYSFAEITMIDDNNDGVYDRAVYIPYSVSEYTSSEETVWGINLKTGLASSDASYGPAGNNGNNFRAYLETEDDLYGVIYASGYLVTGERASDDDIIVYWYNPYSRQLNIVENLGKAKVGYVDKFTFGTYNAEAAVWENATVTIDGTTYKQGYRNNETYEVVMPNDRPNTTREIWNAKENKWVETKNYKGDHPELGFIPHHKDLKQAYQYYGELQDIDEELTNVGFDETVLTVAASSKVRAVEYIALAGRVISIEEADYNTNWIAFNYGKFEKKNNGFFETQTYKGDIVGIDADGNIEVKAYVDGTGAQQTVKIAKINGKSSADYLKTLSAYQDYAAGLGIFGYQYKDMVRQYIIDLLKKTYTAGTQYMYIATVAADGTYEIWTDLALYTDDYVAYRQPANKNGDVDTKGYLTFTNGVADKPYKGTDTTKKILALTDASVITVIGKDGIKVFKGMPKDGDQLLVDKTVSTVYAFSNSQVIIASKDKKCAEIFTGFSTTDFAGAKYLVSFTWRDRGYADGYLFNTDKRDPDGKDDDNYTTDVWSNVKYTWKDNKWVASYTHFLFNVCTRKYESFVSDKPLTGFTFPTLSDFEKRAGVIGYCDLTDHGAAVQSGYIYAVVDGKVKATYAPEEAVELLTTEILPNAYDSLAFIEGKTQNIYQFNLLNQDDLSDAKVKFVPYYLRYEYALNEEGEEVVDRAVLCNEKSSGDRLETKDIKGTYVFYNYVPGTSFTGMFVTVAKAYELGAAIDAIAAAAQGRTEAAVANLVAAAEEQIGMARATSDIPAALTGAMAPTYAEVLAKYIPLIAKEVKALNDADAAAAALAALKAAQEEALANLFAVEVKNPDAPEVLLVLMTAKSSIRGCETIEMIEATYQSELAALLAADAAVSAAKAEADKEAEEAAKAEAAAKALAQAKEAAYAALKAATIYGGEQFGYEKAVADIVAAAVEDIKAAESIDDVEALKELAIWGEGEKASTSGIVYEIEAIIAAEKAAADEAAKEAAELDARKRTAYADVEFWAEPFVEELAALVEMSINDIDDETTIEGVDKAYEIAREAIRAAKADLEAALDAYKVDAKAAMDATYNEAADAINDAWTDLGYALRDAKRYRDLAWAARAASKNDVDASATTAMVDAAVAGYEALIEKIVAKAQADAEAKAAADALKAAKAAAYKSFDDATKLDGVSYKDVPSVKAAVEAAKAAVDAMETAEEVKAYEATGDAAIVAAIKAELDRVANVGMIDLVTAEGKHTFGLQNVLAKDESLVKVELYKVNKDVKPEDHNYHTLVATFNVTVPGTYENVEATDYFFSFAWDADYDESFGAVVCELYTVDDRGVSHILEDGDYMLTVFGNGAGDASGIATVTDCEFTIPVDAE